MAYKIVERPDEQSVWLVASPGHRVLAFAILLVVLLAFGVGAFFLLTGGNGRALVVCFGVVLWGGAPAIMIAWLRSPARTLRFDNRERRLLITHGQDADASSDCVVPYEEINGFRVRQAVSGETSTVYEVSMQRHDGGLWQLYSSSSERRARAFADKLTKQVQYKAPQSLRKPPPSSYRSAHDKLASSFGRLQVEVSEEATVIEWSKRRLALSYLLLLLAVLGAVLVIVGAAVPRAYLDLAILAVGAGGCLLALGGLACTVGLRQRIVVSSDTFEARTAGGWIWIPSFSMANEDIQALVFHVAARKTRYLYFLPSSEDWSLPKVSYGERHLRRDDDVPRVGVAELSLAEVVRLEGMIEAAIWRHAGHEVQ